LAEIGNDKAQVRLQERKLRRDGESKKADDGKRRKKKVSLGAFFDCKVGLAALA
jgi:hypothetical protein